MNNSSIPTPEDHWHATIVDEITDDGLFILNNEVVNCVKLATKVAVPNSVTSISDAAFSDCEYLTSISLPESLTSIGDSDFSGCTSLTSITVAPSNPNFSSFDGVLFNKNQSTLIQCPQGKQGSYAVPNSVTSIADIAFFYCRSLTSISLPEGLTSIGDYAFADCTSLTSVTNLATTPQPSNSSVFSSVPLSSATLYVPAGSLSAYQAAAGWQDFGTIVEMVLDTDIAIYPNAIYASSAEARTSTTVTIPINMKNSVTVRDYSFYLVLPEAIAPSSVTLKKSTARKEDEMSLSKAVQADGSIKVVCYSTDGQPFSGNDGEVATLTFTVPADMEVGDYPIIIKNAEISENGTAHKIPDEIISCLHIESYLLGDANMDGDVSVSDLSCIVNYLLNLEVPETFYAKAADANEDGEVSVSDLSIIVNIILYGNPNGANGAKARGERSAAECLFSAAPFTITPGEEATLSLLLSSDQEVTAFQFDALLPDGLSCVNARRSSLVGEDHSFRSASLDDDLTRIVCYSGSNATFSASEGAIAELTLKADKYLLPGLYALNLQNAEVVSLNGSTKLDAQSIALEVTAPTGIEMLDTEPEDTPRYDLMGHRIHKNNASAVYIEHGKKIIVK